MITKSEIPQIRFKGFVAKYNPKKLEDIVISNTYGPRFNANDYDINGNVKTIRGTDISLNGDIIYKQVPTAKLDTNFINSHILEDGDLVMITTADCGLTGIFEEQKDKFICSAYAVKITLNKELTYPNYFKYFFQTKLAKNEINKLIRKATVSNLPASDILKIEHILPSKLEQKNIAMYFSSLYKVIEQKEKKYQKLKQFKKAMLDKMFPKNGADTPEIRFKGFTGKWEEKKLEEICKLITKGTTPLDKSSTGTINYIKVENINKSSGQINITTKITEEEHQNYLKRSQLQENDILFSIAGTLGRVTTVNKDLLPANTNQALAIIRLNQGVLNYIMTYLKGNTVKNYIKQNPTIGAQPNLSLGQIENIEVLLPKEQEQKKIGNYFQKLDIQIELQQKEIEKLKNIKKASLDKMFV